MHIDSQKMGKLQLQKQRRKDIDGDRSMNARRGTYGKSAAFRGASDWWR